VAQAAAGVTRRLGEQATTGNGSYFHINIINFITFIMGVVWVSGGMWNYAVKQTRTTLSMLRNGSATALPNSESLPSVAEEIEARRGMNEWTMSRAAVKDNRKHNMLNKETTAHGVKGTFIRMPEVAEVTGKVNWSMTELAAAKGVMGSFTPLHITVPGVGMTFG
jgi:hypothetical protein